MQLPMGKENGMNSIPFLVLVSMFMNGMPAENIQQAAIPPEPPAVIFQLEETSIVLAPADGYVPNENEVDAAVAVVEDHLAFMNILDSTVTSDRQDGLITVHIPAQTHDVNLAPEEISARLCEKAEVAFIDPEGNVILEGKHIKKCEAQMDIEIFGSYIVSLEFNDEGTKRFAEATARLIGQEIKIYLDGEVIAHPIVEDMIPDGRAVINRINTGEEALAIADQIATGMLPYKLVPVNQMGNDAP